jgi:hypothetical protein
MLYLYAIAALVFLLVEAGIPLSRWLRNRKDRRKRLTKRACQFVLERFTLLATYETQEITDPQLSSVLRNASPDEAELLLFVLENMSVFGHPTNIREETVWSGNSGFGSVYTTVTCCDYAISRQDLERLKASLESSN